MAQVAAEEWIWVPAQQSGLKNLVLPQLQQKLQLWLRFSPSPGKGSSVGRGTAIKKKKSSMTSVIREEDSLLHTSCALPSPILSTPVSSGKEGADISAISAAHGETQKLLLVPNKAFYLLTASHHMEQVLPEACLGEVQVIVRPYVQLS